MATEKSAKNRKIWIEGHQGQAKLDSKSKSAAKFKSVEVDQSGDAFGKISEIAP